MHTIRTEAIVLSTLPFKEKDLILTLFTPGGIQKIYKKGSKRYHPLSVPLTYGEFLYTPGKKDLHRFQDGSLLDQNLGLRNRFENLQAAQKYIYALLLTQMPDKPASSLFHLFRLFLQFLPRSNTPCKLSAAFYIKVMKHEGILELPAKETYRYGGESFDKQEAPLNSQKLDFEEEALLQNLAKSRSLEQIDSEFFPSGFFEKIETLFQQAFS